MPANIATVSPPMIASVPAALRLLGFLKLGTPLLTASTPVSAVQPEANARSTRPTSSSPATCCSARMPDRGRLRDRARARAPRARPRARASRRRTTTKP